jgi:hypothetical protein
MALVFLAHCDSAAAARRRHQSRPRRAHGRNFEYRSEDPLLGATPAADRRAQL